MEAIPSAGPLEAPFEAQISVGSRQRRHCKVNESHKCLSSRSGVLCNDDVILMPAHLIPVVTVGVQVGFMEMLGEAWVRPPPAADAHAFAVVQRWLRGRVQICVSHTRCLNLVQPGSVGLRGQTVSILLVSLVAFACPSQSLTCLVLLFAEVSCCSREIRRRSSTPFRQLHPWIPRRCKESAPNSESETAFAWNCWATTATLESVTFSKMAGPSTGPACKQSACLLSRWVWCPKAACK